MMRMMQFAVCREYVLTSAALALAVDGWMARQMSYSDTTISSYQYRSIHRISMVAFYSDR